MWSKIISRFVKYIDPKLDKYRPKKPAGKYTPKTLPEFIDILRRTPKSILSNEDRARISAVMSFDTKIVRDLMTPKNSMVFVHEKDFLGPLTLDKLYRSGFTNFPVVDNKQKVKGVIRTEALNALEIKKTDRASKYIDQNVHYLHATDSLKFAIEEIERTGCSYFLVLDNEESLAGFFTIRILLDYLLK